MSETIAFSRRVVLCGLSTLAAGSALAATGWPDRQLTLTVGFPAGGPTDVVGRILAQALSLRLGQSVIVENRPGAAGTTAGAYIARAQPDGYGLMLMTSSYAASAALFRTLPYRPIDDFSFISTVIEFPYVLVTYADHPVHTMAELVAATRAHGPLTFGTSGVGSNQHLAMEQFVRLADIRMQHVPFRGGAPAITELLGKRLDFVIDQPSALVDLVRDKQFRAIAITGAERFFSLPDTPTFAETGYPGFAVSGWQGLVAPPNLPADLTTRLHTDIVSIVGSTAISDQLKRLGNAPKTSTPEAFRSRLQTEIAMWTKVVDDANIERI